MTTGRIAMNGLLALAAGTMMAGVTGCVSHAHWPPLQGSVAYTSPNTPAVEEVMMKSLQWAATRYAGGGAGGGELMPVAAEGLAEAGVSDAPPRMVFNLPTGSRGRVYERIASAVPGSQPLTPENSHFPIYHVGSIRIRGDEAQVNIFRPVTSLGRMTTGEPVYQEVRVDLKGGLSPWHVVSWREWTPGSEEVPALHYYTPDPPPPSSGPRVTGVME